MRLNLMMVSVVAFIALSPAAAVADEKFDDCIRKLCTSIIQDDCWVKGGSAICGEDQLQCAKIPDHAPATVIEKKAGRWLVLTAFAQGWVSDRAMMIDGSACGY